MVTEQANVDENKNGNDDRVVILSAMLHFHDEGKHDANFDAVAKHIGCHPRNNAKRAMWKNLQDKGYIRKSEQGKGFQITEKGIDFAATDEYKERKKAMSVVLHTTEEHQERIKNIILKKKLSPTLFELLQKHGPLSRIELAALVKKKDRSHSFSYALQELKRKFVEPDDSKDTHGRSKRLRLSDEAFLRPEDRPRPEIIDRAALAKAIEENAKPRGSGDVKKIKKSFEKFGQDTTRTESC